ncbi:conserved hypothetical protein [Vibrio chagasii]|nr:conserved hypothetical protein [Vibrio chagasii]
MLEIVFIIGKPGSGKSSVINHMRSLLGCTPDSNIKIYNDWNILFEMAVEGEFFNKVERYGDNGFKVKDNLAYDMALQRLVNKLKLEYSEDITLIVEFSRCNYVHSFSLFKSFLKEKKYSIVYIDTNFKTCEYRNLEREGYSVPPEVMKGHFSDDDIDELISVFSPLVYLLDNMGEPSLLKQKVESLLTGLH